jgi:hypothetical protein
MPKLPPSSRSFHCIGVRLDQHRTQKPPEHFFGAAVVAAVYVRQSSAAVKQRKRPSRGAASEAVSEPRIGVALPIKSAVQHRSMVAQHHTRDGRCQLRRGDGGVLLFRPNSDMHYYY